MSAQFFPYIGTARRIGIAGLPGAGKSTIANKRAYICRTRNQRVGIIAVDRTFNPRILHVRSKRWRTMACRGVSLGAVLGILFLASQPAFSQKIEPQERRVCGHDGEGEGLDDGDFNFGETLLALIFPRGVKDTWRLKRYIRSEKFSFVKSSVGDARATDAIFRRALEIADGDMSEALFISTFATMEHREVGVRLPIIKLPVYFPLTTESDSVFRYRVSQLPSHFYIDSPPGESGDKDKLQHFFGSAFLAYSSRSRGFANFIGDFIEWGESEYIVDGVDDPRDRRANHEGQEFGLALGDGIGALPSDFLQIQLVLTGSRTDW